MSQGFIKPINNELRQITANTITANWQLIPKVSGGSGRFNYPICQYEINNNSNSDIYISFDGHTVHKYIPSYGYLSADISANQANKSDDFQEPVNTGFFVKYVDSAPTGVGYVTISSVSRG